MTRVFKYLLRWTTVALLAYWVVLFSLTHWPHLDVHFHLATRGVIEVDKIAHTAFFCGFAILIIFARPFRRSLGRHSITLAAAVALAYAAFDESSQGIFHRDPTIPDFTADAIAVLSVYLIAMATPATTIKNKAIIFTARFASLLLIPAALGAAFLPAGQKLIDRLYHTSHFWQWQHLHTLAAVILLTLLACAALGTRKFPKLGRALAILGTGLGFPLAGMLLKMSGHSFYLRSVWSHEVGLVFALAAWAIAVATRPLWHRQPPSTDILTIDHQPPPPPNQQPNASESLAPSRESHFVSHALLVSSLTLLSRLTGLVRDAVLAAAFGLSGISDAFFIGFLIPNLFRRLFGEGALTAAFIPNYTELLKKAPDLAKRFASLCAATLTALLAVITLLGEAVLYALLHTRNWSAKSHLAIHLTMIMLPYMPMVCLVALLGGMLQVHKRFGPAAAAPILLNLTMIAATLVASLGVFGKTSPAAIATLTAIGVLLAGLLQLVWQIIALRQSTSLTTAFHGTSPWANAMVRMMIPMLLGLAVFQINTFFDSLIAFTLSPHNTAVQTFHLFGHTLAYPIHTGAVAALQWSQRLYQFPLGVFGTAIATAIFPALARAAAEGESSENHFAEIFRQGLRLTVFVGLPASAGLVLVRLPLARAVYERYAFSLEDADRVATILLGYAVSIWAYSLTGVITRAFYARKDANTPLKISVAMVVVNLALNLILIWPLGAAGLAWSTAICAAIQVVILLAVIRKHIQKPIDLDVLKGWSRTAALTAVMIAALLPPLYLFPAEQLTSWQNAGLLAGMVTLGFFVIVGGAWMSGAQELRWLLSAAKPRRMK